MEVVAKNCTKQIGEDGIITLSCKSKKWNSDAANRASMVTIFIVIPIALFSILSLNLGDKGIFLAVVAPFLLFFLLRKISQRDDTIIIDKSDKILINYVPYGKNEIGKNFYVIETPVDGSYVATRYKNNTIQVTGYFENQVANNFCNEIRKSIALQDVN